ncbi:MAG: PRC-barrel domain-containing protein [Anaerolineae bacterium]|nr:PRC-barrel domain-containing protein [Anaerolineae bacterium]
MISAGEHQGKLLISITNGEKLGEVKDLYFDSELTKVAAVLAGNEGGLFSREALLIARSDVQVYGVDAWLIAGANTVVRQENVVDADAFVVLSDLLGREIQTEGGTKIGTVDDVLLDVEARVLGFALHQVYVQGPLAERKAIARSAILNVGSKDTPMLTVLAQAEAALIAEN